MRILKKKKTLTDIFPELAKKAYSENRAYKYKDILVAHYFINSEIHWPLVKPANIDNWVILTIGYAIARNVHPILGTKFYVLAPDNAALRNIKQELDKKFPISVDWEQNPIKKMKNWYKWDCINGIVTNSDGSQYPITTNKLSYSQLTLQIKLLNACGDRYLEIEDILNSLLDLKYQEGAEDAREEHENY